MQAEHSPPFAVDLDDSGSHSCDRRVLGTSLSTALFAPIRGFALIVIGPKILAAPHEDVRFSVGCLFAPFHFRSAKRHSLVGSLSPTSAVSPMTTPAPWSIKKPFPIFAPGWISIPVHHLTISERKRGSTGIWRVECMKWNNLWNVIARNPGVQKTTSRIPLIPFGIAGSLRIAASKSLLMYSQADIQITLFKSICPMLPLIKKTCRSRSFVFLKNYFACCLA